MVRDVVGSISTGYELDDTGLESRQEQDIRMPVQTGTGAHPALGTEGLLLRKAGVRRRQHTAL